MEISGIQKLLYKIADLEDKICKLEQENRELIFENGVWIKQIESNNKIK